MKIKACIFDLDGTLLNTLTTITYYVNEALSRIGARHITLEECRGLVGKGARNLLERTLALVGREVADFEAFLHDYDVQYNSAPSYLTAPYDGILPLIDALYQGGVRLAVLSNKPEGAVRPLVERFFGDKIEIVAGGKTGIALKPDPAAVAPILHALGLSPSETAFIGDSGVDMQTAKNYGAGLAIGVLWGFRDREELLSCGADLLAERPADILKALNF
jgi:phosphoglycolate phosphatase